MSDTSIRPETGAPTKQVTQPKTYWKSTFTLVVLSEDTPVDGDIEGVAYAITDGDCSGQWERTGAVEVTAAEMAQLLIGQESDPAFFGLTEDGTPEDDDE